MREAVCVVHEMCECLGWLALQSLAYTILVVLAVSKGWAELELESILPNALIELHPQPPSP